MIPTESEQYTKLPKFPRKEFYNGDSLSFMNSVKTLCRYNSLWNKINKIPTNVSTCCYPTDGKTDGNQQCELWLLPYSAEEKRNFPERYYYISENDQKLNIFLTTYWQSTNFSSSLDYLQVNNYVCYTFLTSNTFENRQLILSLTHWNILTKWFTFDGIENAVKWLQVPQNMAQLLTNLIQTPMEYTEAVD